jgi:hypothetical protein
VTDHNPIKTARLLICSVQPGFCYKDSQGSLKTVMPTENVSWQGSLETARRTQTVSCQGSLEPCQAQKQPADMILKETLRVSTEEVSWQSCLETASWQGSHRNSRGFQFQERKWAGRVPIEIHGVSSEEVS